MVELMARGADATSANGLSRHEDVTLFADTNAKERRRAQAWLKDRLARSKTLRKGQLNHEVVDVTPELAAIILLDHNPGNRNIRTKRVERYAEAIADGRWMLTSQGISFSHDGTLNNGQHRLSAIVAAGRSAPMSVTFGEDRDAFMHLDTGGARGGGDTLKIAGYTNTNAMAGAARLLRSLEAGNLWSNSSYTNDLIRETVDDHPGLEEAASMGQGVASKLRCSPSAATFACYLIATQSKRANRLDDFLGRLKSGTELRARDPILVLREGLLKDQIGIGVYSGARAVTVAGAIILAWNRWTAGRPTTLSNLRASADKPFPQPE